MPSGDFLSANIQLLPGIGPALAERFAKLNIRTVQDLLWHVPFRYDDFRTISTVVDLRIGQMATIRVTIDRIANRRSPRRRMVLTEALVRDDSGSLKVVWFNQPFLEKNLRAGDHVVLAGRIQHYGGIAQMVAPTYEKERGDLVHVGRLVPVYPTTAGISERQFRYFVQNALRMVKTIPETLPDDLRKELRLPDLDTTLRMVHFPADEAERDRALSRLKFDELLLFQLRHRLAEHGKPLQNAPAIPFHETAIKKFVAALPFTLTPGQKRAAWDILQDMMRETPMNRLVEGDVGSGKTIVAALAAWNVLAAGQNVALMAPTELLARQHATTFGALLSTSDFSVYILTHGFHEQCVHGKWTSLERAVVTDRLANETKPHVVIGTHTLLEESVALRYLGLVVVDEQQRFGVAQRDTLHGKNPDGQPFPHFLSLTATPIPRTLALALAGDLQLSIIPGLPKGRKPIHTKLIPPEERSNLYRTVDAECGGGRQAFVLAPLIDPSDTLGAASATTLFEELQMVLPKRRIGLLHGKLSSAEKDAALENFVQHRLDILVATSVVEVGIDVPNATVMVIEGAERFGLAQLHQLRGRVGRSDQQSFCYLLADALTPIAKKRLDAVVATTDGFKLAELDLNLRGPGDFAGTLQAGFLDFQFASLGDHKLIKKTADIADSLLRDDPTLNSLPLLKQKVESQQTVA